MGRCILVDDSSWILIEGFRKGVDLALEALLWASGFG